MDVATGSLGQGLPDGVGIALAGKYLERRPYRVWVLCGDSEMVEGSMWEAMLRGPRPQPAPPHFGLRRPHRRAHGDALVAAIDGALATAPAWEPTSRRPTSPPARSPVGLPALAEPVAADREPGSADGAEGPRDGSTPEMAPMRLRDGRVRPDLGWDLAAYAR